jgi:TnpA family transposase
VLNQYAKFELPIHWGPSDKVAADGSLLTTYEDNIQTSYHVRYRRTGAVAYRHVGTNYIAYFTNFLVAGAYEGAYLFDARTLQNRATAGQSRPESLSYPQVRHLFTRIFSPHL